MQPLYLAVWRRLCWMRLKTKAVYVAVLLTCQAPCIAGKQSWAVYEVSGKYWSWQPSGFIPWCQGLQRANHCFWSQNSVKKYKNLILDGMDGYSCSCPACYEYSDASFCRNIGQPAMVSGSFCKSHSLPDLCGYLWILFLLQRGQ